MTKKEKQKQILLIDDNEFSCTDIMNTLKRLGLYDKLINDLILQNLINTESVTEKDMEYLLNKFKEDHNLQTDEQYQKALEIKGIKESTLKDAMKISMQISRFRKKKWGTRANSLYLKEKDKYDLVTYNRLECSSFETMQEVYFRIKDKETTWEDMAKQFKPNDPQATSKIGPLEINKVEKEIINNLRESKQGKINLPIKVGELFVLTELIAITPKQFDETLKEEVLMSEYNKWVKEQTDLLKSKVRIES